MMKRYWMGMGLAGMMAALAFAQGAETRYPRWYAVNHNPWLESVGLRVQEYAGWNNPTLLNNQYVDDLEEASHGLLKARITTSLDLDEFPLKADGFRYDDASYKAALDCWCGWHQPDGRDYHMLARKLDMGRRVDFGEIDELLDQGVPYFGYWETNMHGYNAYYCNSGPTPRIACSRIYVVMGFNCERGVAEMLHDDGHRVESIMSYVYGGWDITQRRNLWERFSVNYGQSPGTYWGIGSCHLPFNADAHYDYADPRWVLTTAPLWETMDPGDPGDFPDLTGTPVSLNRNAWGGADYHRNYMKFYFGHMPHFSGYNNKDGYYRLNNWWEYVFNFNEHEEAGGDFPRGVLPAPNPPVPANRTPVYTISTADGDNWRPQVNSSHRVVWAGAVADGDMEIFSAWAGGAGLVNISSLRGADELPQINASGRIAWQHFDGYDFEIYTANHDGTDVVQVTNNSVQDWHVDINDAGRIVWDAFDGNDYEIYSANADGTDVVQVTVNTTSNGRPRDDMWPRINNNGRIVWMAFNGNYWDIRAADSDGANIVVLSVGGYQHEYPQIGDGGHVVWHAWVNDYSTDVFMADATVAASAVAITNDGQHDWWPQVNSAGDMVWMYRSDITNKWRIKHRLADGTTQTLGVGTDHQQHPVIADDGRVAWQGYDGYDWDIYLYDGATSTALSYDTYHNRAPAIAANGEVAWHAETNLGNPGDPDYRGPMTEIKCTLNDTTDCNSNGVPDLLDIRDGTSLDVDNDGVPDECPLAEVCPGDSNCDGFINFRDIDYFVAAQNDNVAAWEALFGGTPACSFDNNDANGDGFVNFRDIDPFVALQNTTCP